MGVGLIYGPALESLLDGTHPDLAVVELEPQTLWEKVSHDGEWRYRANEDVIDRLAERPLAKLVHGIGQPVGGSVPDPVDHLPLLRWTADRLDAVWVSEHLSFNRAHTSAGVVETGFLLPPRQDAATVRVAAHNVAEYGRALGRPVAFETGVNYLPPRPDEMPDGEFWGAVAERAGSGILLDLHNLWCNEVNGRARVRDVLDRLPLDRVWEIHLAGGTAMDGYWLDAHSDRIPEPLIEIAADAIPRLPNLGAILYEVLPEYVDAVGAAGIEDQIDTLSALWKLRGPSTHAGAGAVHSGERPSPEDLAAVRDWETTLYRTICGPPPHDPGIGVYRELMRDFRRGGLARTLRYTMTLLLLVLGARGTAELLDAYFAECPAQAYRAVEADTFARFLSRRAAVLNDIRYLNEVLNYEHALIRATVLGESSRIEWTADPTAILRALEHGRLPESLPEVPSEMLISA